MAKWGEIKCARCAEADDLVQAAVAAALREAVLQVHSSVPGHMLVGDTDRICDAIFALITPNAQAALDRVVAAEQERCAKVAQRCADLADTNGDYLLICDVVAAIREGRE
jgi:hypothetical protein